MRVIIIITIILIIIMIKNLVIIAQEWMVLLWIWIWMWMWMWMWTSTQLIYVIDVVTEHCELYMAIPMTPCLRICLLIIPVCGTLYANLYMATSYPVRY